ncbi:MAG TPA: TonB family protein [Candidatus Binatia bacterium]|nr:TonB family protein [Candidatus Binatia bacterium]
MPERRGRLTAITGTAMARTEIAAALAFSLGLHAATMALLSVLRAQPVLLFDVQSVPIKVAILDVGDELAGPGVPGPLLVDGAPAAPAAPATPVAAPAPDPVVAAPPPPPAKEEAVPEAVVEIPPPPAPKPAELKVAPRKPIPQPKPKSAPRPPAQKPRASQPSLPPTSGASSSPATSSGAAAASGRPSTGAIPGGGGSGRDGGTATAPAWAASARAGYEQRFSAWIQRFKVYPLLAQRRHLEGSGRMMIRIDRRGRVLARSIEKSSGEKLLDDAALDMVDRADPFPSLPPEYPHETFVVRYSFDFHLR